MKKILASKITKDFFDFLMFIVPMLELSEVMTVIPPHWLPWYMLSTVILRRVLRMLEEHYAKVDSK